MFSAPPVCKSGLKPRNLQGFLWLSGQKHRKYRLFLKCLGFKNGRNIAKTWKDFVRKGFFDVWRLLNGTKRIAMVLGCSAPPIFKSGLKPRYLQVFLWRKGLLRCLEASKWHKATVLTRASAPSCHKTLYIGMVSSYVRFKVATKHRKYHNTSVSRVTPDSLLPFVHPLLSQVLVSNTEVYFADVFPPA